MATTLRLSRRTSRRDLTLLALGWALITSGFALGLGWAAVAVAVAALPVAAALVLGYVSGRGAVAGCLALALGSTLIRPEAGAFPWADLGVMAALAVSAMVGGTLADRMAPRPEAGTRQEGPWMTVVVECGGPSGPCSKTARPKVSPRFDPERRGLARRPRARTLMISSPQD